MIIVLMIIVLAGGWYLWEAKDSVNRGDRAPYVPSNWRALIPYLEQIIQATIIDKDQATRDYHLLELGAGIGYVAHFASRRYTWKSVRAIEVSHFLALLSRVYGSFNRKNRVQYVTADIFKYPLPAPSVIYCYLFPAMLKRLLEEGTFKNQLVISLTFPLPGCEPIMRFPVTGWQKELLVYDFRPA